MTGGERKEEEEKIMPSLMATSLRWHKHSARTNSSGFIQTDLFKKAGRKNQFLLPSSAHPKHTSKGIPFSLAYRLRRICSLAPSSATQMHSQGLEGDNFSALSDWKTHLDLRRMKRPTVPHQLSSRMEDLGSDLKI